MNTLLVYFVGIIIQGFHLSKSNSIQEKEIVMCITQNNVVYFGKDDHPSCNEHEKIHFTHELYDLISINNDGKCVLANIRDCQFKNPKTDIDHHANNRCNGKRTCELMIRSTYWDHPVHRFQSNESCRQFGKENIGIKIYYKCINTEDDHKAVGQIPTSMSALKTTPKATVVRQPSTIGTKGLGKSSFDVMVGAIVGTVLVIMIIVVVILVWKYRCRLPKYGYNSEGIPQVDNITTETGYSEINESEILKTNGDNLTQNCNTDTEYHHLNLNNRRCNIGEPEPKGNYDHVGAIGDLYSHMIHLDSKFGVQNNETEQSEYSHLVSKDT